MLKRHTKRSKQSSEAWIPTGGNIVTAPGQHHHTRDTETDTRYNGKNGKLMGQQRTKKWENLEIKGKTKIPETAERWKKQRYITGRKREYETLETK